MHYIRTAVLALAVPLAFSAAAQTPRDVADAEVRAAVHDYVDALYLAEPQRIVRSVSLDLSKVGVSYDATGALRWSTMSFDQLVSLAERYNAGGASMAQEPREVEVLALESRIASARLTARWGVDYLLLNKDDDGRWRIRHVLWEGRGPTEGPTRTGS